MPPLRIFNESGSEDLVEGEGEGEESTQNPDPAESTDETRKKVQSALLGLQETKMVD